MITLNEPVIYCDYYKHFWQRLSVTGKKGMAMGHTIFIGCIFLTSSIHAHALTLSPLFSDHMVLQRDKPVRIWGEGQANQQVTVSLLDKHYRC